MKSFLVGELKSLFSGVLKYIENGEKVGILFGKNKKPIAMIIPVNQKRKIGMLDGKVKIEFDHNFSITEDKFLSK